LVEASVKRKIKKKEENEMNIYVGNLSYDANEEDLRSVFESYGEVEKVSLIKDNFTGKSKGFGFVEMPDKSAAEKAIAELNGKEIKGRAVNVNEARPRTDRPSGDRRPSGGNRPYSKY
jgi:RNA recognition motif-containing protein